MDPTIIDIKLPEINPCKKAKKNNGLNNDAMNAFFIFLSFVPILPSGIAVYFVKKRPTLSPPKIKIGWKFYLEVIKTNRRDFSADTLKNLYFIIRIRAL